MISYKSHTLSNGLTVIANRDGVSKLAAVNLLYKVGARNENPHRTGFAHLFEHLMFRGTRGIPNFDTPVQMAAGENNAFTTNDYTDYYITLPVANIETALWLESDRMTGLYITPEKLEAEKRVVVEEFKQRYLNQPYGDLHMLLRELTYKVHPYRWSTIGRSPEHIMDATLDEVREFYGRFYQPSNAILSVSADLAEERIFDLAEQYFTASQPVQAQSPNEIPMEPAQTEPRRLEVERDVPSTSITLAWHIGNRTSPSFFVADLVSDLLAGGESARLYQHLVKDRQLFSSINAYVTCDVDPGLFIVTGQLLPGVKEESAERALWGEIALLAQGSIPARELEKVKNKFEANTLFGEINVMNKAMNLGFYAMLGDLALVNREVGIYLGLTEADVREFARNTLHPDTCSTLIYRAKQHKK